MPKILVADDSIAVRKVAERLLTEAGLGVTLAANGEEALAFLAKELPDVIVSDVIMPDKSGYEVCAFVRGNAALAETPVLLISGIVNEEVTRQAESCHANGVLKKPFQGTSLKDRVLELIAKRHAQAAAPVASVSEASAAAPVESGRTPWITPERLAAYQEAVAQAQQVDAQLSAERDRAEQLARRVAELEAVAGRVRELEGSVQVERQQASELSVLSERAASLEAALLQAQQQIANLQEQVAAGEQVRTKVEELQSALKDEQAAAQQYRQQLADFQKTTAKVAELEAALHAEREAAAQLVQQLTTLEKGAARAKELETRLAREEHRATDCELQAKAAETALTTERARVGELSARLATAERSIARVAELEQVVADTNQKVSAGAAKIQELEKAAAKMQEVEGLLSTERDRNGLLTRRVAEAEHAAEQATKRFEDMARKLGEIAGLASQLGHGKGRS
ncbi:MAG: response regulator [Nitrospira sp.]|jgi:CheY-like chemotaxis protein|nr:response regulator [Nitrospira sp.]